MFQNNIRNLIVNLPKKNDILELDIVLEGGGFNGSFELGALHFLKELEAQKYITIDRISGASIGSLLGLCYFTNKLNFYVNNYQKLRDSWKETINLNLYNDFLKQFVTSLSKKQFNSIKTDKLYITFFDVKNKKQIIQSTYTNKQDLIAAICKSSYLPGFTDNKMYLNIDEQFFIDGGQPFIFHDRESHLNKKILYISINQLSKIASMINTKQEINAYGRILEGILDCYEFFLHERPTKMCSFVNQWTSTDFFKLRMKHLLLLVIVYIINFCYTIHTYLQPYLETNNMYKHFKPIFNNLYKDYMLYFCF